jgi:hypothetical protein
LSLSSRVGRLLAAGLQRPGTLIGGLAMAVAAGAIVVNALSFQSARHPSPFFGKGDGAPTSSREPSPVTPPVPPVRPPVTSTAALPQGPARGQSRDPIADLIRGTETTGSAPMAMRPDPQRQIAAAQRALVKLGYGQLKVDGVFGQDTRQAIERFERDRRLIPTGELGPRTARELSAQSGIRVE